MRGWTWVKGIFACIVFAFVYVNVYENLVQQSGPLICIDGWRSPSIGSQGACSHHGGVDYGPIREARRAAMVAALLSAFVAWLVMTGIAKMASLRRRLPTPKPADHVAPATSDSPTDFSSDRCPQCTSELVQKTKLLKNRIPDRIIWQECSKCRYKNYFMLE